MTSKTLEERIVECIARQLGVRPENVESGSSIVDDLGADSLDFAELIMEVESEFGISINEGDAENIETIGDLIETTRRLKGEI